MAALIRTSCVVPSSKMHLRQIYGRCSAFQLLKQNYPSVSQTCCYSAPQRKGFISQIVDNIKEDLNRNKEMKENLKKFREEAEKLEKSEALQNARKKYKLIEKETSKSTEQIKEQLESLKGKLKEGLNEAQKSEIGRKSREITEEFAKSAKMAAEAIAKQGEELGKSTPMRAVAEGVKTVRDQIEEAQITGSKVYQAPIKLRKRSERSEMGEERIIEPNSEATTIELHKDSKWFQSWQNFRENNQYVNKVFDWKMKYDESDNPVVRASRLLTDKVTDLFGGLFQKTELSEVLTEIVKMDPNFDKEKFLKECEDEIIPNILEAMIRGDLEILKDWCYEGPFNVLATPIKTAQSLGYHFDSKVLDVMNVDLAMGKMMEQGPVLVLTFNSQQILVVRDAKANVVEGDPNKVLRMHYVWALCRDQTELDPKAAWKLLDLSASSTEQWL
ncbi:mitochondrial import inner membrane translocase subunit TIM44 isoform X2 [Parasteatoda tepidariorum]|uniref:mitochondrial import inner membrane translocase subunit TIM44 isoform X1 n=2 Tax=Parasteatoda tepidariorum TaxID=114398 RepID=UPI00077FB17D|nr:mitochondrial import inner membrane translocase subunit TIM44 isoform X1 [Parasteatoda tepidariorum]XP_042911762.1 mitochondrial import inner membrane translocase subunit TIM44 isoform X2 [Parasteatoda tepidariorum]